MTCLARSARVGVSLRFSATVRPVTVRQSPWINPAFRSSFITTWAQQWGCGYVGVARNLQGFPQYRLDQPCGTANTRYLIKNRSSRGSRPTLPCGFRLASNGTRDPMTLNSSMLKSTSDLVVWMKGIVYQHV